jgi:hypothetical protein
MIKTNKQKKQNILHEKSKQTQMIYSYKDFIDIIDYIVSNNRWHKRQDKKEGLTQSGNPFGRYSSVSYRKSYGGFASEPVYEETNYAF